MEHFIKKILFPLIALVLSSAPGLAQITIYHGTTTADAASIITNGIQQFNSFGPNAPGTGLYVTTNYQVALRYANAAAQFAASQGATGPAAQPYVLEMVLNDGATVGNFVIRPGVSDIGAGIIGDLATYESATQTALNQFNVINVVDAGYVGLGGETSFMVVHSSAEAYVGVVNPVAADLSMVPSASYVAQAQQWAQRSLSQAENAIVGNASALNSDTIQVLENSGEMTAEAIKNCAWYCGVAAALSANWTKIQVGLQMGADDLGTFLTSSAGIGSTMSAAAILGSVRLCDQTLDNLCSSNINTSLIYLIFGPDSGTGAKLVSQTYNPYTGSLKRDYSDGSTTWNWNTGMVTGVTGSGVGYIMDPATGERGSLTAVDGPDVRTSQILQVNFAGQTEFLTQSGFSDTLGGAQAAVAATKQNGYLTQSGFSDTLEAALAAVAATTALNSSQYLYPALFQVPAVQVVLGPQGTPTTPPQPSSNGTTTLTGTTPSGAQYTTTVQKDSSGNVVSESTTIIGQNFTTTRNDVTGTSLTIQRNPDGSTSIFNCIQKGTVCATDSGIVNFDDGWGGKNPYDASNQTFSLTMPGGGGGGGGPLLNAVGDPTVHAGGCTELGC